MSLKSFHIVLISLSSLLALVFGGWSVRGYLATGAESHLAFAVGSFIGAIGLAVYIVWFARRIRSREEQDRERRKLIRPLALIAVVWLLSTDPANACAVCYGKAEGPMIEAARLGVWVLFGLVLAMQVAFALFFLYLRKRARAYRDAHPDASWVER